MQRDPPFAQAFRKILVGARQATRDEHFDKLGIGRVHASSIEDRYGIAEMAFERCGDAHGQARNPSRW